MDVPIKPEKLDYVTATATKYEHVTGEWLLLQHQLHLSTETLKTTPHVGHPGGNPDLGACS
jgi:hypothetical protein